MEAFDTIASYSSKALRLIREEIERLGPALILEKASLPYDIFFDIMPEDHRDFFKALGYYYVRDGVTCVHGGVDPRIEDLESQSPETLMWGGPGFPEEYEGSKNVVYGHRNNFVLDPDGWPQPLAMSNGTFGIDTISHGVLTAMRFPDKLSACRMPQQMDHRHRSRSSLVVAPASSCDTPLPPIPKTVESPALVDLA